MIDTAIVIYSEHRSMQDQASSMHLALWNRKMRALNYYDMREFYKIMNKVGSHYAGGVEITFNVLPLKRFKMKRRWSNRWK